MTYRILDLFCGAGGAAVGYSRAGFEVVGVDVHPQPRYPFRFKEYDALEYLQRFIIDAKPEWRGFDAIHASPPCQRYSAMSKCRPGLAEKYPDLIGPTRELLIETGLPYIIENVEYAPLKDPLMLCGTTLCPVVQFNGRPYQLQRHRLFEANWTLPPSPGCDHRHRSFPVYGDSAPGNRPDLRGKGFSPVAREVMGIEWMTRAELGESIPPSFTDYIGNHLRYDVLMSTSSRVA